MSDSTPLRVLMIMTSHGELGQSVRKTGVWLESFVAPYFSFRDADMELTLASPCGGMPPIDPASRDVPYPSAARFAKDECCRVALSDTLRLRDIIATDFAAAVFCGGFGAYWDLANDSYVADLVIALHSAKKPMAFIGAGVSVLTTARDESGRFTVEGKVVACISDKATEAAGIRSSLPFSMEQRLTDLGAIIDLASAAAVRRDGNLLTCANDSAGEAVAQEVVHLIRPSQSN